ncbi:MAG: hypothetical protein CNCCGFBP_01270 [Fimbriimonadaceae bacterium]|nr:hypothetical protein [Fimbriimonadaceae bacterium]
MDPVRLVGKLQAHRANEGQPQNGFFAPILDHRLLDARRTKSRKRVGRPASSGKNDLEHRRLRPREPCSVRKRATQLQQHGPRLRAIGGHSHGPCLRRQRPTPLRRLLVPWFPFDARGRAPEGRFGRSCQTRGRRGLDGLFGAGASSLWWRPRGLRSLGWDDRHLPFPEEIGKRLQRLRRRRLVEKDSDGLGRRLAHERAARRTDLRTRSEPRSRQIESQASRTL